MIDLKKEFESSSLTEWVDQLKKELKGDDFSKLSRYDEIEELTYSTYKHVDINIISQAPGNFPFTRGSDKTGNHWLNSFYIKVSDEKISNSKALEVLMKGCDQLIFDLTKKAETNWSILFNEIQFEYVHAQIKINTAEQFKTILNHFNSKIPKSISFSIDFLSLDDSENLFDLLVKHCKNDQIPFCLIDGFSLQQCGATTWQEIGFCIATGHEYLVRLMNNGMSIDEAAACVHFSVGIGSNYFYEIAKIRSLKQNWASIIKEYKPKHNCSHNCLISAQIGTMNKSLLDPYTNLLRQTTEAMSAISGSVNALTIQPCDSNSINGSSIFSERMALNISLILKEESYFSNVGDPLGGSYIVEDLTNKIGSKSWTFFQKLEEFGGISSNESMVFLRNEITLKANLRKSDVLNSEVTLIGINKFINPNPEQNKFDDTKHYLGMQTIIFERDLIAVK